jgi:phage terminase large subunit-like protein
LGAIWFPKDAPWLNSLKAELLGFPNVKHDDQVDSISQALSWLKLRRQNQISFMAPMIVYTPWSTYFDGISSR